MPGRTSSPSVSYVGSSVAAQTLGAFVEVTKPRLTALLVLVAAGSHLLAARGTPAPGALGLTLCGVWLLGSGIFSISEYAERELDALMERTRRRPLPSGRLLPAHVLAFGSVLSIGALFILASTGRPSVVFLGVFTVGSYLLLYVPLKRRTPHHTTLGALSGAMPVLLGWTAAGRLDLDACILFSILFLWQIPHFLSIQALNERDYRRAGVRIRGARGPALLLPLGLLLAASAAPALTGLVRPVYLAVAASLGGTLLAVGVAASRRPTAERLRRLRLATMIYLALLFAGLIAALP